MTDDRRGKAADSIFVSIMDTTSSSLPSLNSHEFAVYPNPVTHTLHFNKECDYEIYTLTGIKLSEGKGSEQTDVTFLMDGLYFFKTNYSVCMISKKSK